ncbi:ComEA family DNA-binding protein [Paenibacillus sp. JSM ZJ436]|uniref:ComEA family DNA-binding protein n=1 Tax=Paenibacillus sp. JSM ZJ436 TaxID=3376190 RepID=UPI00378CA941
MRKSHMAASVILTLLGCGLILYGGGGDAVPEGWKPLNDQVQEVLEASAPAPSGAEKHEEPAALTLKQESAGNSSPPEVSGGKAQPTAGNVEASIEVKPSQEPEAVRSGDAAAGKININTADLNALMELPGIGEAKGQAIIDYRSSNGPFKSAAELMEVKGIGPKMLEKMQSYITL